METSALLALIGAILIIIGLVFTAFQGIWRGRFNREGRSFGLKGFGVKANWPGLVLIVVGALLLLAQALFQNPG
jgi:membrane-bound ClpP family serine protease